jgi:hypothetical protein
VEKEGSRWTKNHVGFIVMIKGVKSKENSPFSSSLYFLSPLTYFSFKSFSYGNSFWSQAFVIFSRNITTVAVYS